jgi:chromosome segregation ATPase
MSSDISIYDDELKDLEDQVQECLDAMRTLKGTARAERYNRAQDRMKEIAKVFHQFNVDLRVLSDPSEKTTYQKKAKVHTDTIAALKAKLTEMKSARDEVDSSPAGGPAGGDGKGDARKLAKNVTDIQNSALASLARSEQLVADSERVGADAAETLRNQTEQIKETNQKLDELESHVQRARRELNAFIRRMMTDKIIIFFTLLVLVGIVVAIVLKIRNQNNSSDGTAAPTPAPPPPPPPPPPPVTPPPAPPGTPKPKVVRYGRYLF